LRAARNSRDAIFTTYYVKKEVRREMARNARRGGASFKVDGDLRAPFLPRLKARKTRPEVAFHLGQKSAMGATSPGNADLDVARSNGIVAAMTRRLLPIVLVPFLASAALGWHTPPHQQITRAALDSLPTPLQELLGLEKDMVIWVNCMYPDRYRGLARQGPEKDPNPGPRDRAELKKYCEMPDGRVIHNVTRNRAEDLASFEHLMRSIGAEIRRNNITAAARYMGTLAHLIEDSCSPAHAAPLPLAVAELRGRQPLPNPPPWVGRLNEHGGTLTAGNLHAAIELTVLPFHLHGRPPELAGKTIAEAAPTLVDRCYAIVDENKADLVEMVRATYANDVPVMDRIRSRAARKAAELLADAYFTALTLASRAPPAQE
jgi:hypothetical protein